MVIVILVIHDLFLRFLFRYGIAIRPLRWHSGLCFRKRYAIYAFSVWFMYAIYALSPIICGVPKWNYYVRLCGVPEWNHYVRLCDFEYVSAF